MYEALNAMVFNVSLREHQVVMLHALSPMSMKLCPFEGFPPTGNLVSVLVISGGGG